MSNLKKKRFPFVFFTLSIFLFFIWIFSRKHQSLKNNVNENGDKNEQMTVIGKEVSTNNFFDKKLFDRFDKNLVRCLIIGSGPSGCGAALYATRMCEGSVVVAEGDLPGGQLTKTGLVENWPGFHEGVLGPIIMQYSKNQAIKFGAIFLPISVTKIDCDSYPFLITFNDGSTLYALSIIIASGSSPKKIGCTGEEKYWGKGVSSCAICDAPLCKGMVVIVVGGGNSACQEALHLGEYAKTIHILVRGPKMRADSVLKNKIEENPSLYKIHYNTQIKEIIGENNDTLKHAKVVDSNNEESIIECGMIFIAIGHNPNSSFLKNDSKKKIKMSEDGAIFCEGRGQSTSVGGIFAAGDIVYESIKQAGSAYGDGIKAAIEAYEFLQKKSFDGSFFKMYPNAWFNVKEKSAINTSLAAKDESTLNEKLSEKDTDEEKFEDPSAKICQGGSCPLQPKESSSLQTSKPKIKNKKKVMIEINTIKEWDAIIRKEKDTFFILDLYTTFCPACVRLKKVFDKMIQNETMPINIFCSNIENNNFLGEKFQVRSVPLLLLMKGEKVIAKHIGYMDAEELLSWIYSKIKK